MTDDAQYNRSITAGDKARIAEAKQGSDALLRRQLETGQHDLTPEARLAALKRMGF